MEPYFKAMALALTLAQASALAPVGASKYDGSIGSGLDFTPLLCGPLNGIFYRSVKFFLKLR